MQKIVVAEKIFTGREWIYNHGIEIADGIIQKILPVEDISQQAILIENAFVTPAFIDAQIYGASGKLFSVFPQQETLQVMYDALLKSGTVLFQPTIATNTLEIVKKAIDAVRTYWSSGGKGVHGLHLEGPWLNPDKRGAHIREWIHPPLLSEVASILDYGKGVITMITVAPEVCSDEVLSLISSHHIVISAGHSMATYGEATVSFEKGISAVTHLYNAMSPLHHREPGLVGATLKDSKIMASIIPDGHHVHFEAISIAKKYMGDRLFAITDAVTDTFQGPYQHQLNGDKYESNGTLSGSAISMHTAFINLIRHAGIPIDEAIRMCSLYPAKALRCSDTWGEIKVGAHTPLLVLDENLQLKDVIA